jgi:hypothetical protein
MTNVAQLELRCIHLYKSSRNALSTELYSCFSFRNLYDDDRLEVLTNDNSTVTPGGSDIQGAHVTKLEILVESMRSPWTLQGLHKD